jgi:hypothetical protein
MGLFFRLTFAIGLLLPALVLLKGAQWICPEIKERSQPQGEGTACWLDAAEGWEDRVQ